MLGINERVRVAMRRSLWSALHMERRMVLGAAGVSCLPVTEVASLNLAIQSVMLEQQ